MVQATELDVPLGHAAVEAVVQVYNDGLRRLFACLKPNLLASFGFVIRHVNSGGVAGSRNLAYTLSGCKD